MFGAPKRENESDSCGVFLSSCAGVGVCVCRGFLFVQQTYMNARDGLDCGGLAVGDMTNGTDVDGGLAGNDLRRERVQGTDVNIAVLDAQPLLRIAYNQQGKGNGK